MSNPSLNEQKEICKLPLDASWHKRCDFKCSDPSSMIRHIGTVHVSPYINHDYGHPILPQWLIQAMKERAEAKGVRHSAESAGPRTPSPFPSSTALGSAPHASVSESPTFDASTQSKVQGSLSVHESKLTPLLSTGPYSRYRKPHLAPCLTQPLGIPS